MKIIVNVIDCAMEVINSDSQTLTCDQTVLMKNYYC